MILSLNLSAPRKLSFVLCYLSPSPIATPKFGFPSNFFHVLRFISTCSNEVHFTGFDCSSFYSSIIDNSRNSSQLKQIYAQLLASGLQSSGILMSKLIHAYSNIGEIDHARKVFDNIPEPNVFIWNAILKGYSKCKMPADVEEMYRRMLWTGISPDSFTFPYALKVCTDMMLFEMGRAVHAQILRHGLRSDSFLQNGLVLMYAKCGEINYAKSVFNDSCEKSVVFWTSIISGCAQNGQAVESSRMFGEMRKMNVTPDWISLVSVLRALTDLEDLGQGKCIHGYIIKLGFELEQDLLISLTAMYAKCGQVFIARSLFDQMPIPNVILWNAMISGYAKNGYAEEAMALFKEMVRMNIIPDSISIRASISACGQLGLLDLAAWMDGFVCSSNYRNDLFVRTALIDMYAKCGSMDMARRVFDTTIDKDVVMWSAMITGYGLHGRGEEAIDLFSKMKLAGISPNYITFVGLLTACKNSGLVKQGWNFFYSMRGHGIEPRHQHYGCIVDLLGRAGHLHVAYKFITNMGIEPGTSVWGALLSACKIHRCVEMGEYAAKQLFLIDACNTGYYVQLSNLYASARMWDRVNSVRETMTEKGLSKELGYSVIEEEGKCEIFRVGDKSHPRFKEIVEKVWSVEKRLKEAGFVADTESVLHDVNAEDVEESLCNHSERLAIAYGLISTPPGKTIRIIKNLRACVNCHSATKFISKIEKREIVVRDANRFHHFKDGVCTCGDYW